MLLSSQNLKYRLIEKKDLNNIKRMYQSEENMQYISSGVTLSDEACALKIIDLVKMTEKPDPYGVWVIENIQYAFVGLLFLIEPSIRDFPSLGYFIDPIFQGQGYATQATQALLEHYFQTTHNTSIYAQTDTNNLTSIHILEKVGFVFEKQDWEFSNLSQKQQLTNYYRLNKPVIATHKEQR